MDTSVAALANAENEVALSKHTMELGGSKRVTPPKNRPTPSQTAGKGRPTPSRKEAQAKRSRSGRPKASGKKRR